MKNTASAISYLHSLRHGWDPLAIDFEHETYFAEPDVVEIEVKAPERSGHIAGANFPSKSKPGSKFTICPASVTVTAASG